MFRIRNVAIAALSACILLATAAQAQQQSSDPGRGLSGGRDPSPNRDPDREPVVPRKMINEPYPFNCGALMIPCSHGSLRPDQNPQVDPHEPTKPNPDDPDTPESKPKPKPQPAPPPPPPAPEPDGPVNKPGKGNDDF